MKAGFAARDITPSQELPMAGFDRRKLPADGALDELQVCALALVDDAGGAFVFCVYDLLGVDAHFCAAVKQAAEELCGLPAERVWVGATHTHSAPGVHFYGKKDYSPTCAAQLTRRGVQAIALALERAQDSDVPAQALVAQPAVTGVASLRNRGRAGTDFAMPLPFLRLQTGSGSLQLLRMACHPTVLDEKNRRYSADLAGALRRKQNAPSLVLNGACGDLSTRFTRSASTPEELDRLARLAACAVKDAALCPAENFGTRIGAAEVSAVLPCAADFDPIQRQALLNQLQKKLAECTDPQAAREYDARLAVLERPPAQREKSRTVRVCAVDFGPFALVGVPFEVDYVDGLALEQAAAAVAGKPVFLVCYTGGYESYLPSGAPLTAESSYEDIAAVYLPEARALLRQAVEVCVRQCAEQNG